MGNNQNSKERAPQPGDVHDQQREKEHKRKKQNLRAPWGQVHSTVTDRGHPLELGLYGTERNSRVNLGYKYGLGLIDNAVIGFNLQDQE